jgi:hypothetical protein
MLKNHFAFILGLLMLAHVSVLSQPCTPQGDQVTYGSNDVWIGYVYDNLGFTGYRGYVTEGVAGNPNFDQSFGGMYANYPTNGCPTYTEGFSVRYKLTKTFTPGSYDFTIAGDDAYRFSIDGGATWIIDNWYYVGFNQNIVTLSLSGTYNMVLEYYDNAHNNRISFNVSGACSGTENTTLYGSGNIWRGYIYNGSNFDYYKGLKNEGIAASANFDQNFGGGYAQFSTSSCNLLAEHFSARYKLTKTFAANNYSIIVSSEDGYRLSLDGGVTWLIDNWSNSTYTSSSTMVNLNGSYDMVLEYHENTGANRIAFSAGAAILLPIEFVSFTGRSTGAGTLLQWKVGGNEEVTDFEIERSKDGITYQRVGIVNGNAAGNDQYSFTDAMPPQGTMTYRIKMQESSGRIKYSRSITVSQNEKGVRIYPTFISNGTLYISNDKSLTSPVFLINDMTGRTVNRYQLGNLAAGQTTSIYSPAQLPKGVYLAQLIDGGQVIKTERIVIQ